MKTKRFLKTNPDLQFSIHLLVCFVFLLESVVLATGPDFSSQTGGLPIDGVGQFGNTTTVNMGSAGRAILEWNSLDTTAAQVLEFVKAEGSFYALNRVIHGGATQFNGTLLGNQGHIIIVNPHGIIFGPTALVKARNFMASTLDIADVDFMQNVYKFTGEGIGEIANYGTISAEQVALIGKSVLNAGTICSSHGYVIMAAGDKVYLSEKGSKIVVEISGVSVPADNSSGIGERLGDVINQGVIEASSGTVVLAAGDIYSRAIDGLDGMAVVVEGGVGRVGQFGTIIADGVEKDAGNISLIAGEIVAFGTESVTSANAGENGKGGDILGYSSGALLFHDGSRIEARGGSISGDGGFVELSGRHYLMFEGHVDASAAFGENGSLLIDPLMLEIKSLGADSPIWTDHLDGFYYDSSAQTVLDPLDIISELSVQNVLLSATDLITVTDAINYNSENTLKFYNDGPAGSILINNTIENLGIGSLIFNSGTGGIYINDTVSTGGSIAFMNTASIASDVTAGALLVMHNDTQLFGNRKLEAGYDVFLADGKTLTGDNSLTLKAKNNINLGGPVSVSANLMIKADSDSDGAGTIWAKDTLNSGQSTILQSKAILEADVMAGALFVMHDDVQVTGTKLEAGYDIFLADGKTLTGDSSLTLRAKNNINLGGPVSAVESLIIKADSDSDGSGTIWAKDTLNSGKSMILQSMAMLESDVSAGSLLVMHDDIQVLGNSKLQAGYDVILANDKSLAGNDALTIKAGNNVNLGGPISAFYDLILMADSDNDGKGTLWAKSILTSLSGNIIASASDSTINLSDTDAALNVYLNNNTNANADSLIKAGQNVILADDKILTGLGNLNVEAGDDIIFGGNVTAAGNLILTAAGHVQAKGTVETTNGGGIEIYSSDNSIYLHKDVYASGNLLLNNKTYAEGGLTAINNIILNDELILTGTNWHQFWKCWKLQPKDQKLYAGGILSANGNIIKKTWGDLIFAANEGVYLAGDVKTSCGNLIFKDSVIACGNGTQRFDADGLFKNLWAQKSITKTTEGNLILSGGSGRGISIYLDGDVTVQDGMLILQDSYRSLGNLAASESIKTKNWPIYSWWSFWWW